MTFETIDKLCCPFDKAALGLNVVTKDVHQNVLEGFFVCNECRRVYPIVKGIPVMSPDEYREYTLEQPLLHLWTKKRVAGDFRLLSDDGEHTS